MNAVVEFRTPYRDLLPPLSSAEMAALGADIEANGLRDPILIDEDGNVLDGHHRLQFAVDPPVRVISGLSEAEKQAFVMRTNFTRRNLSLAQKEERAKVQKKIAKALVAEGKTQQEVATALGVVHSTISKWINGNVPGNKVVPSDSKGKNPQPIKVSVKVSPGAATRISIGTEASRSASQCLSRCNHDDEKVENFPQLPPPVAPQQDRSTRDGSVPSSRAKRGKPSLQTRG